MHARATVFMHFSWTTMLHTANKEYIAALKLWEISIWCFIYEVELFCSVVSNRVAYSLYSINVYV